MESVRLSILVFCFLFALSLVVIGKDANGADLGRRSLTFEIAEEGIITMLKKRLANIDIAAHQEEIKNRAKEQVIRPKSSCFLPRAQKRRIYHFDPTITLQEDARLPCGTVIVRAGTKVNPLEKMEFDRRLWFIDGNDEEQISWLEEQLQERKDAKLEERVILTAGSPVLVGERLGRVIYFDQGGVMAKKFAFKALPAVVVAEKLMLKITEEDITGEELIGENITAGDITGKNLTQVKLREVADAP